MKRIQNILMILVLIFTFFVLLFSYLSALKSQQILVDLLNSNNHQVLISRQANIEGRKQVLQAIQEVCK